MVAQSLTHKNAVALSLTYKSALTLSLIYKNWFVCGSHEVHIGVQQDFHAARKAHPAFAVRNLHLLKNHLLGQGMTIIEDEHRKEEGYYRFFLNDPFGNRMEFLELVELNIEGVEG
ncbi:hypothetical protein [Paenibacillus sp. L3-i20]|uniref:hypothetical protein n=1 Tax=Paenibacillus sp. L3-i20 TaxID=2905833 RepID=UPI001EE01B41|nr:hypothetical protein [Paenibacillus sp. L3-i20]GKU75676.1 hypothetical protein L3i20_v200730 [Paenibacillus sp. L3-i20]